MIKEEFYKAIRELEEALENAFLDNNVVTREHFVDMINILSIVSDDCYATLEELDHENEYEVYDE